MNRREAGFAMLLGAAGAATVLPAAAMAQPPMMDGPGPMGEAERMHAMDTARVGNLALMTSQMAQSKAVKYRVKEFANFEVVEQTTIAQIIRESTGMGPPPPDAMAQQVMARLRAARGSSFDMAYVMTQVDGHQKLLAIQDRYLANGRNPGMRHVAMLARGQITEHLKLLSDIRSGRA